MFSVKKLVFVLALLLTLLPMLAARPTYAQEGAKEDGAKDGVVEEGYIDAAALGFEEAELVPEGDSLGCVGISYTVSFNGTGIKETPRDPDYYYTNGGAECGREIRIRPTNRDTRARIKFFPRNGGSPTYTAWKVVPVGQLGRLATNVLPGTKYKLQLEHRGSGGATFQGRISD